MFKTNSEFTNTLIKGLRICIMVSSNLTGGQTICITKPYSIVLSTPGNLNHFRCRFTLKRITFTDVDRKKRSRCGSVYTGSRLRQRGSLDSV